MKKRSTFSIQKPAAITVVGVALLAGCQIHPVQLPSTGRTVTLEDIRRTQQAAGQRLGRVAARLDVEEWQYHDAASGEMPAGNDGVTSQPAAADFGPADTQPPLQGTRIRYVWDAGHQRLAMHIQPLGRSDAASQPAADDPGLQPRIRIAQRVSGDEDLLAELVGNTVMLERYGKDHPVGARAVTDWPLRHGLENDMFFEMAENWGGRIEAVQEDGLDLVKVTWSAMGVSTIEWFRPDQAFKLHRKETRDLRGQLHGRITASDYRMINGFPYPFAYEVVAWATWDPGRMTSIDRFKIHSAEFNAAVSDDEFKLDVPQGATLSLSQTHKTLLPGRFNRTMASQRVESALRADVETLFRMMDGAQHEPFGEVAAGG